MDCSTLCPYQQLLTWKELFLYLRQASPYRRQRLTVYLSRRQVNTLYRALGQVAKNLGGRIESQNNMTHRLACNLVEMYEKLRGLRDQRRKVATDSPGISILVFCVLCVRPIMKATGIKISDGAFCGRGPDQPIQPICSPSEQRTLTCFAKIRPHRARFWNLARTMRCDDILTHCFQGVVSARRSEI